jgi:membrane-associated phospholipid phosphatase
MAISPDARAMVMGELRYVDRPEHLYPTDLLSMALAGIFGIGCFLNTGKLVTHLFGIAIDRELLCGVFFFLLVPGLPLLFRWVNGIKNRVVQFFRLFYPQILYLVFYQQAIRLSQLFYGGHSLDAFFAHADFVIFSFQPSIRFHLLFRGVTGVNELFFFGYFSFFALITVGWWVLYARGELMKSVSALTVVTFSFYILYLFYALFPVEGPKYYFLSLHAQWYGHFKGYLFTALLRYLFDNVDLAGAAFPSSHVIISTLSLLLNLRYSPRLGAAFLPITFILYLSTVYLYAHYAVDGLAGLVVAAVFWWTIPWLLRRLSRFFDLCDSLLARILHLPPIAAVEMSRESRP